MIRYCLLLLFGSLPYLTSSEVTRGHVTLSNEYVEGKRVIVIGDVHGAFDELIELLTDTGHIDDNLQVNDDAIVILTGDFVNKGPKNIETLRWAASSGAYAVCGNHELNCLEDDAEDKYPWLEDCTEEDYDFLRSLPYTVSVPLYNIITVHAGLMPDVELDDQEEFVMTRMRNIIVHEDGTMEPQEDTDEGDNWASIWEGPMHVVYGHDAGRGKDDDGNPIIQYHDFATGLDSRCVSGGMLSGLMVPVTPKREIDGTWDIYSVYCPEYDP